MTESTSASNPAPGARPAEEHSTLFAHLVFQQSNMAMMLMGKVPNPQSGETMSDLESARFFIDTLEMLEAKTKGNLSKEESGFLSQTLMTLRLAYVEAISEAERKGTEPQGQGQAQTETAGQVAAAPGADAAGAATSPDEDEEHRKKFSKKY